MGGDTDNGSVWCAESLLSLSREVNMLITESDFVEIGDVVL